MAVIHKNLTGDEAIHPATYVQTSDPGAVGDDKLWIDKTTGTTLVNGWLLKIRASSNSAWTTILDLATALALKANLASPTFTGTPAAPTAAPGTNTTQLANTAFVTAAVSAGGISATIVDAKGDLIAGTANDAVDNLTVGANGTVLTAASGETTGLKWAPLPETIIVAVSDESTAITTGAAKVTFRMPFAMTVTAVRSTLSVTSSSGNPTVDINESGTTILSTKLSIDASELTSTTAATAAVISDANLADDAEITIDIDTAGTGAKGLKVYIIGTRA
jgi:hypothetical protein